MKVEPDVAPALLEAIKAPFLATDATPAHASVLQPLNLLLDLAGEAMRARLFVVQGEGGEALALRPDFTIPIAEDHIASNAPEGRFRYDGTVFQAAPPGSDEPDEFLQIGLERFGNGDTLAADAEVAGLAWRSAAAGRRTDLSMVLGDVALFAAFLDSLELAPPLAARLKRSLGRPARLQAKLSDARPAGAAGRNRLAALLSGLPEAEGVAVLQDLWALAGVAPTGGRPAVEIVHRLAERADAGPALTAEQSATIGDYLAITDAPKDALAAILRLAGPARRALDTAVGDWRRRLDLFAAAGVPQDRVQLSAGFGRPFGYYDGVMFEVRSSALGEALPVAAGGRYDGLMARLGGDGGAVGCMVRPGRAAGEPR